MKMFGIHSFWPEFLKIIVVKKNIIFDNIHYAPVEPHALAVGDDGQPDLPQHGGDLPVLGQPAPACHRADLRTNQGSVLWSGDMTNRRSA